VQLTRDGRLVVMHDPTLGRTTTCRGRVDARTLRQVVTRCRARHGERIPALGDALDLVGALGTHVVIDLKRDPSAWTPDRYRLLVLAIRSRHLVGRTVVLGFHRANLEAVRALEPRLRVQAIADDLAEVERQRTWADGINLPASLATPELVTSLREQGLLVLGRKTQTTAEWEELRAGGVDGLLTGRVAPYVAWSDAQPEPPPTTPPTSPPTTPTTTPTTPAETPAG
jgi:glycerophosphoryl diester phosphodiesterase